MRPSPFEAGGRRVPRLTALLLFLLGWLLAGVVAAVPASAHAELISADPGSGAVLDSAPAELTLVFSESVTQVPSAMKLLAADGSAVPLDRTLVEGNTLRVLLPEDLPDAGYVFVYRVISADSHPVAGALTFSVGASATAASSADIAAAVGGGNDPVVAALAGVNRWGGYAGVILLLGVPAFVVLCRRDGAGDPLLRGLTAAGGALVTLTAVASLPLQAARSSGGGLGGGFGEIDTVLDSAYGEAALARLVLVAVLVPALWVAARAAGPALLIAVPAAVGVLVTFARSGHPAVGEYPWATTAVDVVHFGAVAVWIGGLVVLGARLLPRPPADCAATLARWSPVAMAAVGTVAVTGSIQSWRELRSLDAFFDTAYGRWILVKIVGLVLLLALGEFGRRRVQAMNTERPRVGASLGAALADHQRPVDDVGQLRRSVGLELALAAAVLAATSALVVTTPGTGPAGHEGHSAGQHAEHREGDSEAVQPVSNAEDLATAESVTASVELPNEVRVEVAADPARAGSAVLTLAIRSLAGEVVDPPEVTLTASLAEAGIAPITLTAVRAEGGRFTVDAGSLLLAGLWKITVTVRTTETDAGVGSVEIPLRPA